MSYHLLKLIHPHTHYMQVIHYACVNITALCTQTCIHTNYNYSGQYLGTYRIYSAVDPTSSCGGRYMTGATYPDQLV